VIFDRLTASRLGVSPQLIDDTLYDAFGQRQVAILYTPLNQYHVVMEVAPQYGKIPPRCMTFTCAREPDRRFR
jgi:multidrug efflux pump